MGFPSWGQLVETENVGHCTTNRCLVSRSGSDRLGVLCFCYEDFHLTLTINVNISQCDTNACFCHILPQIHSVSSFISLHILTHYYFILYHFISLVWYYSRCREAFVKWLLQFIRMKEMKEKCFSIFSCTCEVC